MEEDRTTFMHIAELTARFNRNIEAYRSGRYNETQLRREFIDPFFKALGWDVDNEQGYAEAYKEVIHEDAIRIGSATKAPDYCFRIGGTRKFFLEAKKPSVSIKDDIHPAYQLRRYAWSAKLPLSILTDFEEFAIYDCRIKPAQTDSAATARVMYLSYREYTERWQEIADIFSREAVLKGSFDKYAESNKAKKGTAEVDAAFLKEIEGWRDELARNIALRNPQLCQRDLNFSVQRTIDRMIFLRICEDRGIESYGQLMSLLNGTKVYPRLTKIFYHADERYNSGLFHFQAEKNRPEAPDELTIGLQIDDKPLRDIIRSLYYPNSPYEFSVLPADILGQVYEQFLGKVIRLTTGHRAIVEDKPEVKKAGGVYYTPTYIVDYIVRNTVGKLLEGKTPVKAPSLKILDPACGSGSFLIGAYQYLLDWYRDGYLADGAEKWTKRRSPALYQGHGGEWRLTTAERKRILLEHIHGVDIDPQAVEVTKLSLLLKVLEGENEHTLANQLKLFHERALPDLGDNIKCGNSLIGPDFYDNQQLDLLDDEERYRINVFDWAGRDGFSEIMKAGGFDVVIGNPPYRMLQPHNTEESILRHLRIHYVVAEYKIEMFHMFLQRGVSMLKKGGYHGYIVPTTLLNNVYAESLRIWLMNRCAVEKISVARGKVFPNADVHTCVIILRCEDHTEKRSRQEIMTTFNLGENFVHNPTAYSCVKQERYWNLPGKVWNILINEENAALITRLSKDFSQLKHVGTINRGLITGDRDSYFSKERKSKKHVPIVSGSDVKRYYVHEPKEYVLFEKPATAGGCWDNEVHLAPHKLVVRQIGTGPTASLLVEPVAVTGNIFTVRASSIDEELYILGIINSRLSDFFWRTMFTDFKSSFPQVTIFSLSQLPIRVLDLQKTSDKARQDRIVGPVNQMLTLHQQLAAAKTAHEKTVLQRQIDATDQQIDRLVYELYGLTEEEIKIVEGRYEN
jgi:type I restriction-modification system DNA methylase subunit